MFSLLFVCLFVSAGLSQKPTEQISTKLGSRMGKCEFKKTWLKKCNKSQLEIIGYMKWAFYSKGLRALIPTGSVMDMAAMTKLVVQYMNPWFVYWHSEKKRWTSISYLQYELNCQLLHNRWISWWLYCLKLTVSRKWWTLVSDNLGWKMIIGFPKAVTIQFQWDRHRLLISVLYMLLKRQTFFFQLLGGKGKGRRA